jgi:hypothetical protein
MEKKFSFKQLKLWQKCLIVGALPALLLVIWLICENVGYKNSTEIVIKQSPFGTMSCVEGQGYYFKGFSRTWTFLKARSFYFNSSTEKVGGKDWEGDDTDEDDIEVTLSRNSKAWISGYLMYELPSDCSILIRLRDKHHTDDEIKHNLVRNAVMSGIAKTAPMFTAEAAKVTNLVEFQALAYDQITQGEYMTETHTERELVSEEEKDTTGKVIKKAEYAEYKVTSLKKDSLGQRIIMNESALHEFEIRVTQFQIRGVKLDSVSQNQLDVVKRRETQRVAKITEAETAKQDAITNEANGRANAAKAKWDAEAEKARVIVKMEQSKDSAIILAEREAEVAKRNAQKAQYQADSTREAGRAQAEANRLKVQAGLTPQERLAAEVQMNKDKWDAISRIQVPIVPEYNIEGGSKGVSGIDALASAKAFEVISGMKSK